MITSIQWFLIHTQRLGLRSEDNTKSVKNAATYAMNCNTSPFDPIPSNWNDLLLGTIQKMKEFPDAPTRYLLILSGCSGNSFEYSNCFPKSSTKPIAVLASTSLNAPEETLRQWVIENIA